MSKFYKPPPGSRLLVAMSGGVDSSVAAAMLKREGYEVIGVTLKLYNGPGGDKQKACCGSVDIQDARKVAAKFDFPHYVVDYESVFKKEVIDRFVDDYLNGITPIPCVNCNRSVKFRDLLSLAKGIKAEALVTGHYARRLDDSNLATLHRAVDHSKDQTYFLFGTTQEQLSYLYFPLGEKMKSEVRQIAEELALPVSHKAESQDICFVPNGNYSDVVKSLGDTTSIRPGNISHIETKNVLGRHNGLIDYTIGQRKRIAISYPTPLYVISMDRNSNTLFVGEERYLYGSSMLVGDLNIFSSNLTETGQITAEVCLRALQPLLPGSITLKDDGTAIVKLVQKGRAITKGQACVIYQGTRVLGGGTILQQLPS